MLAMQAEETARVDDLAWARLHMRSERRERLDFSRRPYLVDILRDQRPDQVVVACAQSAKTTTYLSKVFKFLADPPDKRPRTGIYTFPAKREAEKFSKVRARKIITASPYLSRQIGDIDSAEVKTFVSGSVLYFLGAFTDRDATSTPADLLIHDELDKSDVGTVQMFQDRLRASIDPDPKRWRFSTPTIPGFGIARAWEVTDQSEWVWTCGSCGRPQIFAAMNRGETGPDERVLRVPWQEHLDLEACVFRCAACGCEVERQWILAGWWEVQAPENCGTAGYHLTGIMPPESTASRLAKSWSEVIYPETFVQGHIGLPEVSGDKSLTEDMIAFGDWANTLQHPGPLYAGLDQGKKLDFVAGDGAGKIVCVWRFDDWSEVAQAMHTLHIRMLVADMAPDARPVQVLMGQFPGRVLGADYSLLKVTDEAWFEKKRGDPVVAIARTPGLDATREPLVMGADGGDVFPACAADLKRELLAQLCAAVRTRTEDAQGRPVAKWVETGADHMRHAHLYYRVAAALAPRTMTAFSPSGGTYL
jgi:hypothetical protein